MTTPSGPAEPKLAEAKPQIKIGHYLLKETLGVGTFGKVKGRVFEKFIFFYHWFDILPNNLLFLSWSTFYSKVDKISWNLQIVNEKNLIRSFCEKIEIEYDSHYHSS